MMRDSAKISVAILPLNLKNEKRDNSTTFFVSEQLT